MIPYYYRKKDVWMCTPGRCSWALFKDCLRPLRFSLHFWCLKSFLFWWLCIRYRSCFFHSCISTPAFSAPPYQNSTADRQYSIVQKTAALTFDLSPHFAHISKINNTSKWAENEYLENVFCGLDLWTNGLNVISFICTCYWLIVISFI